MTAVLDLAQVQVPATAMEVDASDETDRRWMTESGVYISMSVNADDPAAPGSRQPDRVVAGMLGRYKYHRAANVDALVTVEVPGASSACLGLATIESRSGESLGLLVLGAGDGTMPVVTVQVTWPAELGETLQDDVTSIVESFRLNSLRGSPS